MPKGVYKRKPRGPLEESKKKYTREVLLERFHDACAVLGHQVTPGEMEYLKGFPSSTPYVNCFGSWSNLLRELGLPRAASKRIFHGSMPKTCTTCHRDFEVPYRMRNYKFCSRKCFHAYTKGRPLPDRPKTGATKICENCGKPFYTTQCRIKARFCSAGCARGMWKKEHPSERPGREGNRRKVKRGREVKRRFICEYLFKHPCVDCGEKDLVVLEFDHVKGTKKESICRIIQKGSMSRLSKEIKKCVVRCSNCHRRRHAKANGFYRSIAKEDDHAKAESHDPGRC